MPRRIVRPAHGSVPDPAVPADCRRCGVCCVSAAPDCVRVTGDDRARLGAGADRRAHFLGHRAFMRMTDGHCAALAVRRAADGTADFVCTLCARRPRICRDLDRGSPVCAGELHAKAARVAAAPAPTLAAPAPVASLPV